MSSSVPIFIINYNLLTYTKNMVNQLLKYVDPSNIYIIDNNSTFPPLLEYYKIISSHINIIYMPDNYGHTVFLHPDIQKLITDYFIITDPDLKFNDNLPSNFIDIMIQISKKYNANKVGFALDISDPNIRNDITVNDRTIIQYETPFWDSKIQDDEYSLYDASIDTTFCLKRKYIEHRIYPNSSIRIADNFTCTHIPWLNNYLDNFLEGEAEYYMFNNKSSTWFKKT